MQREIRTGQAPGCLREIDADHRRTAAGEADEIGANAATDLEDATSGVAREVDERWQIGELVESIFVEIGEELARTHRRGGHLQIVDPTVPVLANAPVEPHCLRINLPLVQKLPRGSLDTTSRLLLIASKKMPAMVSYPRIVGWRSSTPMSEMSFFIPA